MRVHRFLHLGLALAAISAAGCPAFNWTFEGAGGSPSASSAASGDGGSAGGKPVICAKGATQDCYSGPPGTKDVGVCVGGQQTCLDDGSAFGPCAGEVVPSIQHCSAKAKVDDNCDGIPSCAGQVIWNKLFGDAKAQLSTSLAVDAAGDVILTGYIQGTTDFGNGPLMSQSKQTPFLAKLDPDGKAIWSQRFGGMGTFQSGWSVAVDPGGNIAVAGEYTATLDLGLGPMPCAGASDVFVARFDAAGKPLWATHLGGPMSSFYFGRIVGLAVDQSGNVLVTSEFSGTIDLGKGPLTSAGAADVLVAKIDPSGTTLWSHRFGDAADQQGTAIAVDGAGNMVVTGQFGGALDFGKGPLTSAGNSDVFVVKIDPAGNAIWSDRFGGTSYDLGVAVAFDPEGNVIVTGQFDGAVDFGKGPINSAGMGDIFALKLDPGGAPLWAKTYGDSAFQNPWDVATDADGNILLAGSFQGAIDLGTGAIASMGSDDGFFAKLDPDGTAIWANHFGDPGYQAGRGIRADRAGAVFVTGPADGTIDLGAGPLKSAGGWDILLAKLGP